MIDFSEFTGGFWWFDLWIHGLHGFSLGSDPIESGEPEVAEPDAAPLWLRGRRTLPMVSVEEFNTTQENHRKPTSGLDPFVSSPRMLS